MTSLPRTRAVRSTATLAAAIVGCLAIHAPRPALARPGAAEVDHLREGVGAYDGLEYERAVVLLENALKESLTRDERVSALRTIAQAQFALGKEAETRAALERLLRVDPSHELDRRQPPRLRQLMEETRGKLATQPAPRAHEPSPVGLPTFPLVTAPEQPREGQPVRFRVGDVRDAPRLQLYYRSRPRDGAAASFSLLESARSAQGSYEIAVPGPEVHAPRIEYYAFLLDGAGTPLARAGALGDPLALAIAPYKKPIYKKAWFWGTLVGVAAAAGLAAALAITLQPEPSADVTLQLH